MQVLTQKNQVLMMKKAKKRRNQKMNRKKTYRNKKKAEAILRINLSSQGHSELVQKIYVSKLLLNTPVFALFTHKYFMKLSVSYFKRSQKKMEKNNNRWCQLLQLKMKIKRRIHFHNQYQKKTGKTSLMIIAQKYQQKLRNKIKSKDVLSRTKIKFWIFNIP